MGLIFKNFGIKNLKLAEPDLVGMVIAAKTYLSTNGISWAPNDQISSASYGSTSSGDRFLANAGADFRSYKQNTGFVKSAVLPGPQLMRAHRNGTTGTIIARAIGSDIYRSTDDGLSWTLVHTVSPTSSFNSGLHYGNGVWFHSYVDTSPSPRTQNHLRSTNDGLTWSSVGITGLPTESASQFAGFTRYMNGLHWAYLAYPPASGGNIPVCTSSNALTWTQVGVLSNNVKNVQDNYGDASGIFYRNGFYYSLSNTGLALSRSSDGFTFSTYGLSVASGTGTYSAAGYMPGPGLWVLANTTGSSNYFINIWTTPDPTTTAWTLRYTDTVVNNYPKSAFGYNQGDWQAT